MEMLKDLLKKNRSYRRFYQEERIEKSRIEEFIGLTRFCSSAGNLQSLKYYYVIDEENCNKIFHSVKWAAALPDWNGAEEGERPSAYIIQVLDQDIAKHCLCDDGLQIQAISLAAVEQGYGVCIIKSFNIKEVKNILNIGTNNYEPIYVIALGKPKERVVIEDIKNNDVKYWRDEKQIHHVPKRKVEDIIIK